MNERNIFGEFRTISLATFEQGAFALSNMALALGISRKSGLAGVGEFGVAIALSIIAANLFRAIVTEPALLSGSSRHWVNAIRSLLAAESLILLALTAHTLLRGAEGVVFFGLALFGAQIAFEVCRLWGIGASRYRLIVGLDLIWLVFVAAPAVFGSSAQQVVAGWCLGAVVGGLVGLFSMAKELSGSVSEPPAFEVRRDLVVIFLSTGFVIQLAAAVIAALDVTVGGAFRIAQTLLGPSRLVIQGLRMGFVSRCRTSKSGAVPMASSLSLVAFASVGVGVVAVLVGLESNVFAVFGITRTSVLVEAILFLGIDRAMVALGIGPAVVLRSRGQTNVLRDASIFAGVIAIAYIALASALAATSWLQGGPLIASGVLAATSWFGIATKKELMSHV